MTNQLRQAIEQQKAFYIDKLIQKGIFKVSDKQLYHFTLSELQTIYLKDKYRERLK